MITAVKGMNDILPEEIPKWRFVEETARRIFRLYGFSELRTPVLEKTELFARSMGADTDVVEKQMYTFQDKTSSSMTLRPEATASVMRAVIEHGLLGRENIQKLFFIGPMFRYERPQKGRYRQFHQINCERLGESGPLSDAETLSLAYEIASAQGISGIILEVNSLGCPECRPHFKKSLQDYLENKKEALCPDCLRRMHLNPLRVLDCKIETCKSAVEKAPENSSYLCKECSSHYDAMLSALNALEVPYEKNPKLVRGLDYYNRTAFEITATGLGAQNAIGGGGRYDGLVAALGGSDVPGIGFAFGMERLLMLVPDIIQEKDGCFVVVQGETATLHALKLAAELRKLSVESVLMPEKSFKVQMKNAGRSGYPFCAVIGENEVKDGTVSLKDLRTGMQETMTWQDFLSRMKGE